MCSNTLKLKICCYVKEFGQRQLYLYQSVLYLSFDASTTTGRNLEQVISDPITGAIRDIARSTIILWR